MRHLRGAFINLTVTAAFLLSAILFAGLQLRRMAPPPALAAYAMPDGTLPQICGGGAGHTSARGAPHCLACLAAVSPGLVWTPVKVGPAIARPIAVADATGGDPLRPRPAWPPQCARAPPLPSFA